jgi:hypothetical protein
MKKMTYSTLLLKSMMLDGNFVAVNIVCGGTTFLTYCLANENRYEWTELVLAQYRHHRQRKTY